MNFAERRKEAERQGVIGNSERLKLQEGGNKIRLMSECIAHAGTYKGTRTFKWLCYVLDHADHKVKPFFMPHSIYKQIEALQLDPDYSFESIPMPFDIKINAKGAGTKDVEYTVIPAPKHTSVNPDALAQLRALKPLADLKKALDEKNAADEQQHGESHTRISVPPVTEDDIPF